MSAFVLTGVTVLARRCTHEARPNNMEQPKLTSIIVGALQSLQSTVKPALCDGETTLKTATTLEFAGHMTSQIQI